MLNRILTFVCLLGFTASVLAADNGASTTRYLVTTDHVKPEMMTEWRALQKNEVLPALKKAGVSERGISHGGGGYGAIYQLLTFS